MRFGYRRKEHAQSDIFLNLKKCEELSNVKTVKEALASTTQSCLCTGPLRGLRMRKREGRAYRKRLHFLTTYTRFKVNRFLYILVLKLTFRIPTMTGLSSNR